MNEVKGHRFIEEVPNTNRKKVVIISVVGVLFIVIASVVINSLWYSYIKESGAYQYLVSLVVNEIAKATSTGLFYASVIGGIFFIPMPLEIFYYYGLVHGNNIVISFFLVIIGYTLSQYINYLLGSNFSPLIMPFISKKKLYKARRSMNKYGGYAVFFATLVPLPSEIIIFALGITKYNVYKLLILVCVSNIIKYLAIIGLFILLT